MSKFLKSLRSFAGKTWQRTKIVAEIAKLKLDVAKYDRELEYLARQVGTVAIDTSAELNDPAATPLMKQGKSLTKRIAQADSQHQQRRQQLAALDTKEQPQEAGKLKESIAKLKRQTKLDSRKLEETCQQLGNIILAMPQVSSHFTELCKQRDSIHQSQSDCRQKLHDLGSADDQSGVYSILAQPFVLGGIAVALVLFCLWLGSGFFSGSEKPTTPPAGEILAEAGNDRNGSPADYARGQISPSELFPTPGKKDSSQQRQKKTSKSFFGSTSAKYHRPQQSQKMTPDSRANIDYGNPIDSDAYLLLGNWSMISRTSRPPLLKRMILFDNGKALFASGNRNGGNWDDVEAGSFEVHSETKMLVLRADRFPGGEYKCNYRFDQLGVTLNMPDFPKSDRKLIRHDLFPVDMGKKPVGFDPFIRLAYGRLSCTEALAWGGLSMDVTLTDKPDSQGQIEVTIGRSDQTYPGKLDVSLQPGTIVKDEKFTTYLVAAIEQISPKLDRQSINRISSTSGRGQRSWRRITAKLTTYKLHRDKQKDDHPRGKLTHAFGMRIPLHVLGSREALSAMLLKDHPQRFNLAVQKAFYILSSLSSANTSYQLQQEFNDKSGVNWGKTVAALKRGMQIESPDNSQEAAVVGYWQMDLSNSQRLAEHPELLKTTRMILRNDHTMTIIFVTGNSVRSLFVLNGNWKRTNPDIVCHVKLDKSNMKYFSLLPRGDADKTHEIRFLLSNKKLQAPSIGIPPSITDYKHNWVFVRRRF